MDIIAELDLSLSDLPPSASELERNFAIMRELEIRAAELVKMIDSDAHHYLRVHKNWSPEEREIELKKIKALHDLSDKYAQGKMQLALQTCQLLKNTPENVGVDITVKNQSIPIDLTLNTSTWVELNQNEENASSKLPIASSSALPQGNEDLKGNEMKLDSLPVDPNEPLYCYCNQISYGEMIACDNVNCPVEWFHFSCVGIKVEPKGEWFCRLCSQDDDE